MVPNEWRFTRLGSVAELQRGFDLPSAQRQPGSVPIISSAGATGLHDQFRALKPGVVTGRYGSIGNVFYIEENYWPLNTTLWVKNFHGNCEKFVYYLLSNFDFSKFSDKTGVPGVNRNDLHSVKVAVPPIDEQKVISQLLSTWDDAISANEDLLANSRLRKKALMQTLLTSQKRLLDKNGKRFEGTWGSKTVGEVGRVVTGSTPPKNDMDNYGGIISWATAEDFIGKYVSDTKLKLSNKGAEKARIVPEGSVLVTCIASIGKNAIAREKLGTNQQINAVIVNKDNSNEFLYYQIEFNVNSLLALAGTTAVPIINKSSFEKVRLSFPTIGEQCAIAAVLTTADEEIEALEQRINNLKLQKKALMQQLLTGKKRVKVESVIA